MHILVDLSANPNYCLFHRFLLKRKPGNQACLTLQCLHIPKNYDIKTDTGQSPSAKELTRR